MSHPKFLFDECIGKPIMEEIARAVAFSFQDFQVKHIIDFQLLGTNDDVWIPQIANEGWVIITGDRGKGNGGKGSGGEKLPVVCKAFDVTHVILSATLHNSNSVEKIAAILAVWPDLIRLNEAPKGSRHQIQKRGRKPFGVILVQIDPPPEVEP